MIDRSIDIVSTVDSRAVCRTERFAIAGQAVHLNAWFGYRPQHADAFATQHAGRCDVLGIADRLVPGPGALVLCAEAPVA